MNNIMTFNNTLHGDLATNRPLEGMDANGVFVSTGNSTFMRSLVDRHIPNSIEEFVTLVHLRSSSYFVDQVRRGDYSELARQMVFGYRVSSEELRRGMKWSTWSCSFLDDRQDEDWRRWKPTRSDRCRSFLGTFLADLVFAIVLGGIAVALSFSYATKIEWNERKVVFFALMPITMIWNVAQYASFTIQTFGHLTLIGHLKSLMQIGPYLMGLQALSWVLCIVCTTWVVAEKRTPSEAIDTTSHYYVGLGSDSRVIRFLVQFVLLSFPIITGVWLKSRLKLCYMIKKFTDTGAFGEQSDAVMSKVDKLITSGRAVAPDEAVTISSSLYPSPREECHRRLSQSRSPHEEWHRPFMANQISFSSLHSPQEECNKRLCRSSMILPSTTFESKPHRSTDQLSLFCPYQGSISTRNIFMEFLGPFACYAWTILFTVIIGFSMSMTKGNLVAAWLLCFGAFVVAEIGYHLLDLRIQRATSGLHYDDKMIAIFVYISRLVSTSQVRFCINFLPLQHRLVASALQGILQNLSRKLRPFYQNDVSMEIGFQKTYALARKLRLILLKRGKEQPLFFHKWRRHHDTKQSLSALPKYRPRSSSIALPQRHVERDAATVAQPPPTTSSSMLKPRSRANSMASVVGLRRMSFHNVTQPHTAPSRHRPRSSSIALPRIHAERDAATALPPPPPISSSMVKPRSRANSMASGVGLRRISFSLKRPTIIKFGGIASHVLGESVTLHDMFHAKTLEECEDIFARQSTAHLLTMYTATIDTLDRQQMTVTGSNAVTILAVLLQSSIAYFFMTGNAKNPSLPQQFLLSRIRKVDDGWLEVEDWSFVTWLFWDVAGLYGINTLFSLYSHVHLGHNGIHFFKQLDLFVILAAILVLWLSFCLFIWGGWMINL